MTRIYALAVALCGIIAPLQANAASLDFLIVDDPGTLQIGDKLEVSITSSSDFPNFTGINFDISYDADVLSYVTTSFSSIFDFEQESQAEPAGAIGPTTLQNITAATLGSGGESDNVLATLSFVAVGTGSTELTVFGTAGQFVVGPDLSFDKTLTVSAIVVPLPATGLLLIGGLLAFRVLRGTRSDIS